MKKIKIVAICQSCGAVADRQSDQILNGSDDMYSCPNCKQQYQKVSFDSLPIQLEKVKKE
jgi:Zn finger protein HypA/HybF involved in hydrogenase expression